MKYLIIIISVMSLLTACGSKTQETTDMHPRVDEDLVVLTDAQRKNAELEIGAMSERNITTIIKLNGKIDVPPQNMVSVSMPLGGYLRSTKLLPGMQVRKGEAIATLEDAQYIQLQQEYLTTKSKLLFSEKELKRQRELNADKASSDKVYQQAQLEYNTNQVTLNSLAEKLKLIHINPNSVSQQNISRSVQVYSPINGFVSKVNVNIGKYVTPADILFELINPTDIHLNLSVFEKDLDKLFIGQQLVAYSNSNPSVKYPCSIILISKDLTAEHTADVHCHFEKYDHGLSPGMYMNAELETSNTLNSCLPEDAIVSFESKDYVFVQEKNNQFRMTEVSVGSTDKGYVQINEPEMLNGKQIVMKNAYTLLMKLKNKEEE